MSEQMEKAFSIEDHETAEKLVDALNFEVIGKVLDAGTLDGKDSRYINVMDEIGTKIGGLRKELTFGNEKNVRLPNEVLVRYAQAMYEIQRDELHKDLVGLGDDQSKANEYLLRQKQLSALGVEPEKDQDIEFILGNE